MTLFKLAGKNMKKNFSNYFLYFASMIFSIMIYYTFLSIASNQQVIQLADHYAKIDSAFNFSAYIIAIFSAIFIWYSNSFFTKKRKKEIGLYSLLGVRKRQIGRMLFYENIIMGALALAAGIFIGSILSKFFVLILVRMMGFDVGVKLFLSYQVIKKTVILFMLIFLITSVHAYSLIYRFKLVDLFSAEKQGQKVPKSSRLIAIGSMILIGLGYRVAFEVSNYHFFYVAGITLFLVVTGTYGLFRVFTVAILKFIQNNKRRYWKGVNLISTSQLLFRIKGHGLTLATIAIISATTLTAIGTVGSIYYGELQLARQWAPFDYSYYQDENTLTLDKKVDQVIADSKHNVIADFTVNYMMTGWNVLKIPDVKLKNPISQAAVMSEEMYNRMAEVRGDLNRLDIEKKEVYIFDRFFHGQFDDDYVSKTIYWQRDGEEIGYQIMGKSVMPLLPGVHQDTRMFMIVDDSLYQEIFDRKFARELRCINVSNSKGSGDLTDQLMQLFPEGKELSAFYPNYRSRLVIRGLVIFTGAFLGLVFLAATGSIIYFKQLTESHADKEKYQMLKNIGLSWRDMKRAISKQMIFVFATPLIVGIAHSWVALTVLGLILNANIMVPVLITTGAYTLTYLFYYFLTVHSYSKIVDPRG